MAACSKCGKQVGCGCGLKGGLCATCADAKRKEEAEKAQVKDKNEQPK